MYQIIWFSIPFPYCTYTYTMQWSHLYIALWSILKSTPFLHYSYLSGMEGHTANLIIIFSPAIHEIKFFSLLKGLWGPRLLFSCSLQNLLYNTKEYIDYLAIWYR